MVVYYQTIWLLPNSHYFNSPTRWAGCQLQMLCSFEGWIVTNYDLPWLPWNCSYPYWTMLKIRPPTKNYDLYPNMYLDGSHRCCALLVNSICEQLWCLHSFTMQGTCNKSYLYRPLRGWMLAWSSSSKCLWRRSRSCKLISLKHNILEHPPLEQKPLSEMHFELYEQLKDDHPNILIAKWILINTIMQVGITPNTLLNRNSTLTKEDHLQIHPFQSWKPGTLGNRLHMYRRQRSLYMRLLFNIINISISNDMNFILRTWEHVHRFFWGPIHVLIDSIHGWTDCKQLAWNN